MNYLYILNYHLKLIKNVGQHYNTKGQLKIGPQPYARPFKPPRAHLLYLMGAHLKLWARVGLDAIFQF